MVIMVMPSGGYKSTDHCAGSVSSIQYMYKYRGGLLIADLLTSICRIAMIQCTAHSVCGSGRFELLVIQF